MKRDESQNFIDLNRELSYVNNDIKKFNTSEIFSFPTNDYKNSNLKNNSNE